MRSISSRNTLALAAVLLVAATTSATALFRASAPGQDLGPLDGAETLIHLVQGNRAILWTTLEGSVASVVTQGWPSVSNDSELGGAMVIEIPADGAAGIIDIGEKPMSATFEIG